MNGTQTLCQVPPPPRKEGCGCCAAGCGTMGFIGLALVALLFGAIWYGYVRLVDALTDPAPIAVQMEEPSEAQLAAATEKLQTVRNAAARGEAVTVEFTAADLNALIARHPEFADYRGKMRVAIAGSIATMDLSVPLSGVKLPRVRHRWFNGRAEFGFAYDEAGFRFSPRFIEAGGLTIDEEYFRNAGSTFDTYFNEELERSESKPSKEGDLWRQIRSAEVRDDKLVITTKGGEDAPSATATPTPSPADAM